MNDRKLVVVGDEAFFEDEWAEEQARLAKKREQSRAYYWRNRERVLAYMRRYRELHRDKLAAYSREWMARYRAANAPVGALHSLSCTGPHQRRRKDCIPIPVWSRKVT